jgi:hypothetical protein
MKTRKSEDFMGGQIPCLSPPLERGLLPNSLALPNTVIYIDILLEGLPKNSCCGITSSPWLDVRDGAIIHASDHP